MATKLLWAPRRPKKKPKGRDDYWDLLPRAQNVLVSVKLRDKNTDQAFWVSTYHMPCKFWNKPAMVTFAALAAQTVQRLAKKEPYVLLGDWNLTPSSNEYKMLTTGGLPKTCPDYPSHEKTRHGKIVNWQPKIDPMNSAYVLGTGAEPAITNHAISQHGADKPINPFSETLDYIFLSQHWSNVTECIATPTKADLQNVPSFPSGTEPSDHVMVGCTLAMSFTDI